MKRQFDGKWEVWPDRTCGWCGFVDNDEEEPAYKLSCPNCSREGCDNCMPAGRGCICPDCESAEVPR